jgi:DNA-binding CsgD family transcriptional regulator/PAS domain-containing protein
MELGPPPALFDRHLAAPFLRKNPGVKVARSSDILPSGAALRRTAFYKQSMKSMGWRFTLALFFWVDGSLDCVFSSHRSAKRGDFEAAEVEKAERLHGDIEEALHRVKALSVERVAKKALEVLVEQIPLPAVIVDWNLRPVFHNAAARDLCGELEESPNAGPIKHHRSDFRLPAPLLKACEELKTKCETKITAWPARLRGKESMRELAFASLRASVMLVPAYYPLLGEPSFLLTLEKALMGDRQAPPSNFGALAKLTRAQRQIVDLVCQGKSNQEIADRLSRTLGTIKIELNAIFKRLGVESRSKLIVLVR